VIFVNESTSNKKFIKFNIDDYNKIEVVSHNEQGLKVIITPEMAEELLKRNCINRTIKKPRVQRLANAIKRGEWRYNGEPIKMTNDDRLYDGQHRLSAIVVSRIPILTNLILNVQYDDDLIPTIDQVGSRSLSDILTIQSKKNNSPLKSSNSKTLAAVVGMIYTWPYILKRRISTFNNSSIGVPTKVQLEKLWNENPRLINSLIAEKLTRKFCTPSIAVFCHYIFSNIDENDATKFFNLLLTGAGLELNNPILTLRDRLLGDRNSKLKMSFDPKVVFFIKTWNSYRANRPLSRLIWNREKDKFPFPN